NKIYYNGEIGLRSCKSIIEYYLKYNRTPSTHVILNSKTQKSKDNENTNKNLEKEYLEITVHVEGTDIELKDKIEYVKDIKSINIEKWLSKFEEISIKKNWNWVQSKEIISHLIKDDTIDKNEIIKGSFENLKLNLMKNFSYEDSGISALISLEKVKQINFVNIEDYFEDIKKCVDDYAICEKIGKKEKDRRIRDGFIKGLGEYTDFEICKQNLHDIKEILEYLTRLEKKLISRTRNLKFEGKNDKKINYEKLEIKKSKWCQFHRSKSHNKDECFENNNHNSNKNNNNFKKKDDNFILKEPDIQRKSLEVEGSINDKNIIFTIDTGASRNYIQKDYVKKLKLPYYETSPIKTIFGNNNSESSDKIVECKLKFGRNNKKFNVYFYILNDLPVDVILGNEFLIPNKCILDLVKLKIWIDNDKISMVGSDENDQESTELDKILSEKLNIVSEETIPGESIKDLENYFKINNYFKSLKINPKKIKVNHLLKNIQLKSYKVPHKYINEAISELKRLEKEGIIEKSLGSYSSPGFFIEKKNKDLRLVVDYKKINESVIDEICEIPCVFQNIQNMKDCSWFSSIDLKNGFNQIVLDEESREFTGFNILNRHYQYRRIPFGIKSGPKIFQKVMNNILENIENIFVYIDDIIIYTESKKNMKRY
ncbi:Retrovirus-related Pol polyprotein from transposon 17.6, partial [Dictyocoela muelleri]